MAFSVQAKDGKNRPILTCNNCGKPIENWESAIVTFPNRLTEGPVAISGIYHKVSCDPTHLGDRSREYSCWMPLTQYLPWLMWNHSFGQKVVLGEKRQLIVDIPISIDLD